MSSSSTGKGYLNLKSKNRVVIKLRPCKMLFKELEKNNPNMTLSSFTLWSTKRQARSSLKKETLITLESSFQNFKILILEQ